MGGGASAPLKSSEMWNSEELADFLTGLSDGKFSSYSEIVRTESLTGIGLMEMTAAAASSALNCEDESQAAEILEELEKRRSLQLAGDDDCLADGQRRRENSELVTDVERRVIAAGNADRPAILMEHMRIEAGKGEKGEVEFASWSLAACTELSQGNKDFRAVFIEGGVCDLVLQFMTTFATDIFVQWQACQCIGALSASKAGADEFGIPGLQMLTSVLCRTDVNELGFTGIWALQNLLTNSATNMQLARAEGATEFLVHLREEFDSYPQLVYSIDKLIKIVQSTSTRRESIDQIASPIQSPRSPSRSLTPEPPWAARMQSESKEESKGDDSSQYKS